MLRALEIERSLDGKDSPRLRGSLSYLSDLYGSAGDLRKAESMAAELVRIERKQLAEESEPRRTEGSIIQGLPPPLSRASFRSLWNPYVKREGLASSIYLLARLHGKEGNLVQAGRTMDEALEIEEQAWKFRAGMLKLNDLNVLYRSMYVKILNAFLATSLDARASIDPAMAYRRVLAWKGVFQAHDRRVRQVRERPELAPLFAELEAVSAEVGRRAASPPAPSDSAGWR
jgi:hypothetical protein